MLPKLTSRKFWLAILADVCAIILMALGSITPDAGIKIILGSSVGFLGAEGLVDFGRALGGGTRK